VKSLSPPQHLMAALLKHRISGRVFVLGVLAADAALAAAAVATVRLFGS